jgi:hypothetical protein
MKKALPYLLLLITSSSFAQIESYKNLLLPNVELHQFTISSTLDFRGGSSGTNLDFPINANFYGYKNYRYRQTFYSANVSNWTYMRPLNNQRLNSSGASFSIDHTRYNSNYLFFRVNTNGSLSNNYQLTENEDGLTKAWATLVANRTSLSIGKGRLEPIDWAIRASFMNKNLVKSGGISGDLPEDVLLELAKTMASVDRSRFYENRFYNIRRIKALDSVMQKNGIDYSPLEYFTTLNDQYFFTPRRNVFTGSRIQFTINQWAENEYQFRVSDSLENYDRTDQKLQYFAALSYEYHLPKNLHLHHMFNVSLNYGEYDISRTIVHPNDPYGYSGFSNNINLSARYQLQWFPSTRTSINWSSSSRFGMANDDRIIGMNTRITCDFFINRRLQYQFGGSFNFNRVSDDNSIDFSYNYALFGSFAYQIW